MPGKKRKSVSSTPDVGPSKIAKTEEGNGRMPGKKRKSVSSTPDVRPSKLAKTEEGNGRMPRKKQKSVSSTPDVRPSKLLKTTTLREKTKDTDFLVGPVKNLEWTEWILAIYQVYSGDKANPHYELCRHKGWEWTDHKRVLFETDTCKPVIFEVGVKFPEEDENVEIHAVYFKAGFAEPFRSKYLKPLQVIKTDNVRKEMLKLVRDKSKIYIRRATGWKKDITRALKRMEKYDYAWGWGFKRNNTHRKIVKS